MNAKELRAARKRARRSDASVFDEGARAVEDGAITRGEWLRTERRDIHFVAPVTQRWSAS